MAVVYTVETGTVVAGANSFVLTATIDQWALNHAIFAGGYTAWSALPDTPSKQMVAILAADYLRNEQRYWWRGNKVINTQNLPWPRIGCIPLFGDGTAIPSTLIPQVLMDAQCELACAIAAAPTKSLQPPLPRGGQVKTATAGRGLAVTFEDGAMIETLQQLANGILHPLLRMYRNLPVPAYFVPDLRGYADASDPANQTPPGLGVTDRPDTDYQGAGNVGAQVSGTPLSGEAP